MAKNLKRKRGYEDVPLKHMRRLRDKHGNHHHFSHPLVEPRWVDVAHAAHMRADDPVLGLHFDQQAWALPWWIMKNHHMANLVLNGRPVYVALCERCSSAAAFDPVINGKLHTFRLEAIYNGTIMAIDHETQSLWAGFTGESLHGPMQGTIMQRLPLVQCSWQEWQAVYPQTLVPDGAGEPRDGHGSDQYPGAPGMGEGMAKTLAYIDDRLPHNALVLGVQVMGHCRCYPLSVLAQVGHVLNDTLGGQDIAVFCKPGSLWAIAFQRKLDDQGLTFRSTTGGIVDENTGSLWHIDGHAISGRLAGRRLQYVFSGIEEFYIWAAFHRDTEIYEGTEKVHQHA